MPEPTSPLPPLLSRRLVLGALAGAIVPSGGVSAARTRQTASPRAPRLRRIGDGPVPGTCAAVVVETGHLVHTAMLHPSGALRSSATGGDRAQVDAVLQQLAAVLEVAGTSLEHLVRLHVYVADANVTPAVDAAIASGFVGHPPALTVVVSEALPPGVRVACDAVAATMRPVAAGRPQRLSVPGWEGPDAGVAIQPEGPWAAVSGRAADGPFDAAIAGTLAQLRADLQGIGLGDDHVVHVKSFLSQPDRHAELRAMVAAAFGTLPPPPQTITHWTGTSVPAEIELVAVGPVAGSPPGASVSFVEPIASRFSRVARVTGGRPVYVSGLHGASADPARQVDEIFDRLRRLASDAGSDMRHLVKATYYVASPEADARINAIRPTIYAADAPPAASKIGVMGLGRPGHHVTIDMILTTRQ